MTEWVYLCLFDIYIYIYIYVCLWLFVCVCVFSMFFPQSCSTFFDKMSSTFPLALACTIPAPCRLWASVYWSELYPGRFQSCFQCLGGTRWCTRCILYILYDHIHIQLKSVQLYSIIESIWINDIQWYSMISNDIQWYSTIMIFTYVHIFCWYNIPTLWIAQKRPKTATTAMCWNMLKPRHKDLSPLHRMAPRLVAVVAISDARAALHALRKAMDGQVLWKPSTFGDCSTCGAEFDSDIFEHVGMSDWRLVELVSLYPGQRRLREARFQKSYPVLLRVPRYP